MEYPSNSREPEKVPQKKIEKVVQGEVQRRKTPLGRQFRETFINGSAKSAANYAIFEILVPAARDMISDAGTAWWTALWQGQGKTGQGRAGRRQPGYTTYSRYTKKKSSSGPPWDRTPELSKRDRATHNFDDIVLPTRVEAEAVIDGLFNVIAQFEIVTVADLYDLLGVTSEYTDQKWGWTDIRGAGVAPLRGGGYLLDLPKPGPID